MDKLPGWQQILLRYTKFRNIDEYYQGKFIEFGVGVNTDAFSEEPRFLLNDIGMAALFREVHEPIVVVIDETGEYRVYDGTRFKTDMGLVFEICKCFVTALDSYAKTDQVAGAITLIFKGKEYMKFKEYAASFHSYGKRKSLLADAATINKTPIEKFDNKPFLVNCLNGTYDLKAMKFRDHSPDDYLTIVSRVIYDESARCIRWDNFISEIMGNAPDKEAYLKKVMGYSLSGDRSQRCFAVLYGPGTSNGKSTLVGSIEYLLGDYAKTAQPQTIAKRNSNGSAPSPDLARLKGVRFVNMPEPSKDFELDAALVRQLTGGDPITARFLRGNPFQYIPEFFIVIPTNFMLQITDLPVIKSKRMRVIQFNHSFINSQEVDLKQQFREPEAMSAILNWLIEGYRKYKDDENLETPDSLQAELNEFELEAEGQLDEFLAGNLIENPTAITKISEIHKRHSEWAMESSLKRLSKHAFLPALKTKYRDAVDRDAKLGNVLKGFSLIPLDDKKEVKPNETTTTTTTTPESTTGDETDK